MKKDLKYIGCALILYLFAYGVFVSLMTGELIIGVFNTVFQASIVLIVFLYIYLRERFPDYFISKRFKQLPPKKQADFSAKSIILLGTLFLLFGLFQVKILPELFVFYIPCSVLWTILILLSILQLMGIPTIERFQRFIRKIRKTKDSKKQN